VNQQTNTILDHQGTVTCSVLLYHTLSGRTLVAGLLSRMCALTQEGGVYGVPWAFTTTWLESHHNGEGPSLSISTEHGVDVIISFTAIEANDETLDLGGIMNEEEGVLRVWCIADGDHAERLWFLRSIFRTLPGKKCPYIVVECKDSSLASMSTLEEHVHHFERLLAQLYRMGLNGHENEPGSCGTFALKQKVAVPPIGIKPEDRQSWMLDQRVLPLCIEPSADVGPLELLLTLIQFGLLATGFDISPRTHHPILSQ